MSKNEILQELSKLTEEEREEIRSKLNELDGDVEDELTDEQIKMIEDRIADYEKNPTPPQSLEDAMAEIRAALAENVEARRTQSHR